MLKKINKQGDITAEEVVKIILAVMGISILVYLGVSLFGMPFKKSEVEQAKESLNLISSKLNLIEKDDKLTIDFFIESPNKWWIIAWPYKDGNEKPFQCKQNSCICICPYGLGIENSLKECNLNGICKDISTKIKTIDELAVVEQNIPLEIAGITSLQITKQNNEIIIKRVE